MAKYGTFKYGTEKYGLWQPPITNRTADDQYTQIDLNRVGQDVQYLADLLNSYGYAVTVSTKTDWAIGQTPRATQMATYLANVAALRVAFYGTQTLPSTMNNLTADGANRIELQLLQIETFITNMIAAFYHSGMISSGGQGGLIA